MRASPADITDAPKPIQELASKIQGKSPAEIRAVIIGSSGPPQRNVGSGLRIEQWDRSDGVLTFHPWTGPTFFDKKAQKFFRLLQTHNPAGSNILDGYEMMTLPDPNGSCLWLGNVKFGPKSAYKFVDSRQFRDQRAAQTGNFFMLHPSGSVEVRYVAPVTRGTLLESVAEGATVAQLVFTSADHKHQATFSITSSERERRLVFGADKPLSFQMDTSWKNFWR
jgi:hypothetical protein